MNVYSRRIRTTNEANEAEATDNAGPSTATPATPAAATTSRQSSGKVSSNCGLFWPGLIVPSFSADETNKMILTSILKTWTRPTRKRLSPHRRHPRPRERERRTRRILQRPRPKQRLPTTRSVKGERERRPRAATMSTRLLRKAFPSCQLPSRRSAALRNALFVPRTSLS
jgi:hypothetical protein